jgi:hypothetical protein
MHARARNLGPHQAPRGLNRSQSHPSGVVTLRYEGRPAAA